MKLEKWIGTIGVRCLVLLHDTFKCNTADCEILLFPSTSTGEAFGLTQLEAMYHAKPIINTWLHTGVNEVGVDGFNAVTVAPGDPEPLVQAITKLLRDSKLREELGKRGRELLQSDFSLDVIRREWSKYV